MAYRLSITERAAELLDDLVEYLILNLNNRSAAIHLLESVESVYDRLIDNPMQFPLCDDFLLRRREYRKAVLPGMAYVLICRPEPETKTVYVLGIFHELENYRNKL